MRRKPFLPTILILSILALSTKAFSFPADVQDISGSKYFPAVKEAIANAEKSIKAVMFLIELPQENSHPPRGVPPTSTLKSQDDLNGRPSGLILPEKKAKYRVNNKVQQLVDELIKAHERGVKVEVILDQNVDFVNQRHESDWLGKVRSFRAYKQLKEAGVAVHYDEISTYTHAKAIVIDEKIVILGSTNWTQTSLERSIETDALINSEEVAKSYLEYFKTIEIDDTVEKYIEFLEGGIVLSNKFMQALKLCPEMMKQHDERSIDIYLYLLKEAQIGNMQELTLDYGKVAEYLGIDKDMNEIAYRRQITKVLKKLDKKYELIKVELQYGKDAKITLLNNKTEAIFHLPKDYFAFGWNRLLSMRAKFCYLINFSEANISDTQPYWTKSVKDITGKYGNVSQFVIARGMGELRSRKLIEVMYDDLTDKEYRKRKPKMYKIVKLYDPKELDIELARVAEQYGEKEYKTARKYAETVFEEYNTQVIEDIILKTKQYGQKKIKGAFEIVAKKNIDNPKRKYSYVVGILENWGE